MTIFQRRMRIYKCLCLTSGVLVHCAAWNANTCFSHQLRAVTSARSSLYLSADDSSRKNEENDLQSLLNRGDTGSAAAFSSLMGDTSPEAGIPLDADTYLNADSLLQPDGTLNLGEESKAQKVKNPLYQSAAAQLLDDETVVSTTPERQQTDDQLLFQAVANMGNNPQLIDPDELHQQVFAEEKAYLEQSEEFRKSLSTTDDDGTESPMAKARREAIESYNDEILEKLLEEIDEIEKLALTKEDAIKQAKTNSNPNERYCSKCGWKLTRDVIERFDGKKGQQNTKMICNACNADRLRSKDEARIRLGVGNYGDASSAKMWDKKKYKPPRDDAQLKRRTTRSGVDTSSMFQMPRETRMTDYDVEVARRELETMDDPRDSDTPHRMTPRTRELGSRELQRRIQQQQQSKSELTRIVEKQSTSVQYTKREKTLSSGSPETREEWTRVTDEKSKRTLFWNKATGEMRKTPPGS